MSNEKENGEQDTEALRASLRKLESEKSNLEGVVDGLRRARAAAEAGVNVAPDWFKYDQARDIMEIHGMKYAGGLFVDFAQAMPENQPFRIVGRRDGVVTIQRIGAPASADNPSTAGAAKGGITVLEVVPRYDLVYSGYINSKDEWLQGEWIKLEDLRSAIAAPALNPSEVAQALADTGEGIGILDNLIDSIKRHGNYSQETTINFLNQALQCFGTIRALKAASKEQQSAQGEKGGDE